jgi:hypothetical protein
MFPMIGAPLYVTAWKMRKTHYGSHVSDLLYDTIKKEHDIRVEHTNHYITDAVNLYYHIYLSNNK